jgi:hypothetical protein
MMNPLTNSTRKQGISLITLPADVLNDILVLLDGSSLAACFYTCKVLYYEANRRLYLSSEDILPEKPEDLIAKGFHQTHLSEAKWDFEVCLSREPSNAQYIQTLTTYDLSLKTIWENTAVSLKTSLSIRIHFYVTTLKARCLTASKPKIAGETLRLFA